MLNFIVAGMFQKDVSNVDVSRPYTTTLMCELLDGIVKISKGDHGHLEKVLDDDTEINRKRYEEPGKHEIHCSGHTWTFWIAGPPVHLML